MSEIETSWWWRPEPRRRRAPVDEVREPAAAAYAARKDGQGLEDDRFSDRSARALSDAELVSLLLEGAAKERGLEEAQALLARVGGLAALVRTDSRVLRFLPLSPQRRVRLAAAVELARRLARCEIPQRAPMDRPREIACYLALRYGSVAQEVMGALFLDCRNRLIALREIFRGATNRCAVEPRAILREALLLGAQALVLFHTHPSGDPSPSAEDYLFTRRIHEASETVGIRLVDHVVVGEVGRWVSLRQRRPW